MCNSWIVSCKIIAPSMMFRPGRKVVCDGLIIFSATLVILLVSTLVKFLKLTLSKHIGLYCCIWLASLLFGRRIIVPKFNELSAKDPLWNSPTLKVFDVVHSTCRVDFSRHPGSGRYKWYQSQLSRFHGHMARELGQVAHGSTRAWHLGRGAGNMDVAKRVDPGHLSSFG